MGMHSMRSIFLSVVVAGTVWVVPQSVRAEPPRSGEDIAGKKVYLAPSAALRYGASLLSRVYTRTGSVLELQGTGPCTTFNCPVTHNGIALYARRVRLDVVPPPQAQITPERTLRRGDEGEDVRRLQETLISKGYRVTADGKFGQGTEDAVIAFQRSANLNTDGAVGPSVRDALALNSGTAVGTRPSAVDRIKEKIKDKIDQVKGKTNALASINRTLRRGDEGEDVRLVQEVLVARGFDIKVDGKYGQGTQSAVRQFQRNNGLNPDGSVGPITLERL